MIQTITYFCKNSVAYYNEVTKNYDKALTLLGWNNAEISAQGANQYTVLEDGCKSAPSTWDKTIIEYSTTKVKKMPIVVSLKIIIKMNKIVSIIVS